MVQLLVAIGVLFGLFTQSSGSAPSQSTDRRPWYVAYEDAKKAIEQKNWTGAIASLEHAKRNGPPPGRSRQTYGTNFVTFAPDYFLGVAYLNLDRFSEAHAAFQSERKASVLTAKDREWPAFQTNSARAEFEFEFAQAGQLLAAADFKKALESVDRARRVAVGAERTRAESLQAQIVQADADAKAPKPPTPPAGAGANPTLPVGPGGVPGGLGSSTGLTPPPSTDPAKKADPGPSSRGEKPPNKPGAGDPRAGTGTNPAGTSRTPGSVDVPTPGDPEQLALTKYFRGDYAGAAADFRELVKGEYPAPRHQFFLACSLAATILSGQPGDRAALEADARAQFAAAGPTAQFGAALTYISPRVIEFLERNR